MKRYVLFDIEIEREECPIDALTNSAIKEDNTIGEDNIWIP